MSWSAASSARYTHVSDQYTTFGTQIIVSTERYATYTLDEILGNTSELAILEHATDSHGQTLATFVKDHENSPGPITGIPHPRSGR
ncbi:MAG: Tn3 family transposase [Solirubrobacteraceae bacterium]